MGYSVVGIRNEHFAPVYNLTRVFPARNNPGQQRRPKQNPENENQSIR